VSGSRRRLGRLLRTVLSLRALPPRVAVFYGRALWRAAREGDRWGPDAAARPAELGALLELGRGRRRVVEIGTAMGWTAIALALADADREVTSFDPVQVAERARYLGLVSASVRRRIEFAAAEGTAAAAGARGDVELLFIDASHERDATRAEFESWRPMLAPGAIVAFHDYGHPAHPGVAEAIADLGLTGEVRGGMFVWRSPG
jgi:predicted O-methyltransferase YrrM